MGLVRRLQAFANNEAYADIINYVNGIIAALDGDVTYPDTALSNAKAIKHIIRGLQKPATAADDNPHGALGSLRSIGYHYDGNKTENGVMRHRLSYKMRRTPEHNAQLINTMKQHGFTHEKIEGGHKFTRPDAHVTALSKPGATRIVYSHRAVP